MDRKFVERYIYVNAEKKREALSAVGEALYNNYHLEDTSHYSDITVTMASLYNTIESLKALKDDYLCCLDSTLDIGNGGLSFHVKFRSPLNEDSSDTSLLFYINISTSQEVDLTHYKPFDAKHMVVYYNSIDDKTMEKMAWLLSAHFTFLEGLSYLRQSFISGTYWDGDIRTMSIVTRGLDITSYLNLGLIESVLDGLDATQEKKSI